MIKFAIIIDHLILMVFEVLTSLLLKQLSRFQPNYHQKVVWTLSGKLISHFKNRRNVHVFTQKSTFYLPINIDISKLYSSFFCKNSKRGIVYYRCEMIFLRGIVQLIILEFLLIQLVTFDTFTLNWQSRRYLLMFFADF